tara:strand:- start:94333 stop:94695 length:363 start_codon:yes stop_codon:yes gene_type:complete
MNNMRDKTPREPILGDGFIVAEYRIGNKLHGILVQGNDRQNWTAVGALFEDGSWNDVTPKVAYHAGVFKNFHRLAIKPSHIDARYKKLSFVYPDDTTIHVNESDVILTTLRTHAPKTKKQ